TTAPVTTTTTPDPTTTDFGPCPTTTTTTKPTTTTTQTTSHTHYTGCGCANWVDPSESANWKKVVKGVYTSDKGGLQMKAEGWKTYNLYNVSMVPESYNNQGVTNAICVALYDPDPADVFATKTVDDFVAVLQIPIDSISPTTVCGYPAYYATSGNEFYIWVVNTPNYKYFISFMHAEGSPDVEPIAHSMMQGVTIYK
ncbi:MAG: hypothetical protein IKY44_03235, partial [Clostridia bacterium]|nr:hypothetical protein [Clostridia bacterium]